MRTTSPQTWDLDIDEYINPYAPRNRIKRLPTPISRFLGHRDKPCQELGNIPVAAWSFVGAFLGLIVIEAVFMIPAIHNHGPPILIASFGAAAVLEYNAISSPFAQPRNAIIGHILAALMGISTTKLFSLNSNFENLRWLAGAMGCGLASAAMALTKTVYPPAGATALLAAVDPQVEHLGWYLLPLVCLSAVLTLFVSLLINNIQRQYPTYWWTRANLERVKPEVDIEKSYIQSPSRQTSFPRISIKRRRFRDQHRNHNAPCCAFFLAPSRKRHDRHRTRPPRWPEPTAHVY